MTSNELKDYFEQTVNIDDIIFYSVNKKGKTISRHGRVLAVYYHPMYEKEVVDLELPEHITSKRVVTLQRSDNFVICPHMKGRV